MSEPDFDVLVVGELNADLILQGNVTPTFGQVEQLVDQAELVLGSSSAIFACGAARLGLRVAFVGKIGADSFGQFVLQRLQERGIDTRGVRVDPALNTGLSVILSRGVDRAILTYSGSIAALRYEEIDLTLLDRARHLHLGSFYLLDQLRPDVPRLFQAAHRRGLTVSLDTNYDPSGCWQGGIQAALAQADVFLPNQTELLAIARTETMAAGLERLSELGLLVAVKQGAEGATAAVGARRSQEKPIPVQVVDTVGAGDSFDAGFVYGFLQPGWPLEKMLRLGCVCGSLSTRAAGGTAGQPSLDETLACLA